MVQMEIVHMSKLTIELGRKENQISIAHSGYHLMSIEHGVVNTVSLWPDTF